MRQKKRSERDNLVESSFRRSETKQWFSRVNVPGPKFNLWKESGDAIGIRPPTRRIRRVALKKDQVLQPELPQRESVEVKLKVMANAEGFAYHESSASSDFG